jgi:hypothetical protein
VSGDGASASHCGMAAATPTPDGSTVTSRTEDGRAPAAAPALSVLDWNWLLDDGMGHGAVGLVDVPLRDPSHFF